MTSIGLGLLVFACTFSGALIGIRMRATLPDQHLSDASKDVVHLCMGLIATLTALILGLVTASAKSTYDDQDASVKAGAANILTLDRMLARYGPAAQPIRAAIRPALVAGIETTWSGKRNSMSMQDAAQRTAAIERIEQSILDLEPQNASQRWLQAQALELAGDVLKTRWQSFAGAGSGVPVAFLAVIFFWLTVLFWSFGLFAPRNGMVIGVLLVSAVSVAASVFLILEMQNPFEGMMTISKGPMLFALANLGQ